MNSNKKIIKILDYYKDYNLPQECFKCDNLKNLLELSAINNIPIFERKKDNIKVNSKKKIIKECRKLKKIKLKELTKELNGYNITESDVSCHKIKDTNDKYVNNIQSIDNIIKILNNDNNIDYLDELVSEKNDFIEVYSNN